MSREQFGLTEPKKTLRLAEGKSLPSAYVRGVLQPRRLTEARLFPGFLSHDTASNGTTTEEIRLATPVLPLPTTLRSSELQSGLGDDSD